MSPRLSQLAQVREAAGSIAASVATAGMSQSAYMRGLHAGRRQALADEAQAREAGASQGRRDGYAAGYEQAKADLGRQVLTWQRFEVWAVAAMVVICTILLAVTYARPSA